MKFTIALLLGLSCLLGLPSPTHAAPQASQVLLEDIKVGQQGERTRFVFKLAKPMDYRWFTLPQPSRLVIDFPQVPMGDQLSKVKLPVQSLVKAMRAGNFRTDTTRLVMDLKHPGTIKIFTLPATKESSARLVVDINPTPKGEKPTNVLPPEDVVTALAPEGADKPDEAPVVPPRVVQQSHDDIVVALDAGHGGVDPGACGGDLCEKRLNLEMVRRVKAKLERDGYKVILTRSSDEFIPLKERVRIAQRNRADLFVSLHADAHPTKHDVRGATVYMVSDVASDKEAARLAKQENSRDIMAGIGLEKESVEVRNILIDLLQSSTKNNSTALGKSILSEMEKKVKVRKKDLLFAGFRVLKAPDVPSVLVEMGYLSNTEEAGKLGEDTYRETMATLISQGIRNYIHTNVFKNQP